MLSGAYAVLYGAPALVVAVDRYVVADSGRPASFRAPEVLAALRQDPRLAGRAPPDFDASALRSTTARDSAKLGLGSSAAITAASIAALLLSTDGDAAPGCSEHVDLAQQADDGALAAAVFPAALRAHRAAQPGGSGIDVAAACFGGALLAQLETSSDHAGRSSLRLERAALPDGFQVQVYWSGRPASTQRLLGLVRQLETSQPQRFAQLIGAQVVASQAAAQALRQGSAAGLLAALNAQCAALDALGAASGAEIVDAGLRELAASVDPTQEAWLPAGAGGGDVSVRFKLEASTMADSSAIRRAGEPLELGLSARGVHACPESPIAGDPQI